MDFFCQLRKGEEEGGLAFGEFIFQESGVEEEEESLLLLLGTQGEVHTQEEGEFVEREHENVVFGVGLPKMVHSDDHLAVEIPETAHQISHGMIGFCFSIFLCGFSFLLM